MSDPAPIWPFQNEIQDRVAKGLPIALAPIEPEESAGLQEKRTVRAEWLAALASQPDREVRTPIALSGVIVRGSWNLKYATTFHDVSITDSIFDSDVDFSSATFQKAVCFERTEFRGKVLFNGAQVKSDLQLAGARFQKELEGTQIVVTGSLDAAGATFSSMKFIGARISGQAVFSSAQFLGPVRFDLIQFDGGAFFNPDTDASPAVVFHDVLGLIGTSVKMQLNFASALFQATVEFDGLAVAGDANFEKAIFVRPLLAPDPNVQIEIRFIGVHVTGQAIFEDATFDGQLLFYQNTIEADALFCGAKFKGKTRFDQTHFLGLLFFAERDGARPAEFFEEVSFHGTVADRDVYFKRCCFDKNVSFQDAKFNVVYFRDAVSDVVPKGKSSQFPDEGKVDLRGFTYSRIYVAWKEMLDLLEPFDQQPYRLMENVFRTMGKEKFAGDVYVEQRWRSLKYSWQRWRLLPKALTDSLYYAFFRFGVRPMRLIAIILALLAGYAWIFSLPGALTRKVATEHRRDLTYIEGLGVSFNTFMPVDVPIGSGWQATDAMIFEAGRVLVTFSFLATILRLAGWLLVPLGTAVFGGLLRRPQK
jgi:uncharacterized protein YjbI with pentapeptide repeats